LRLRPAHLRQHAVIGDVDADRQRRAATGMTARPHDVRQHCGHADREIGEHVAPHSLARGVCHRGSSQPRDAVYLRSDFPLLDRHHWLFINLGVGQPGEP
jgi:hypothetical protein